MEGMSHSLHSLLYRQIKDSKEENEDNMSSLAGWSLAPSFKRILIAVGVLAVFVSVALAQTDTGSLQGTVTDSSGAVVSGASVSVTNLGTATW